MKYLGVTIRFKDLSDDNKEIMIALLDSLSFEGITELEGSVIAYIPVEQYNRKELENLLKTDNIIQKVEIESEEEIEEKNWNQEWEKNFDPVIVDNLCAIRAPFHPEFKNFKYVINIEPKMSFGTGHHETTSLMVSAMLKMDFANKAVLDMGCGTGLLAILASKMGAKEIVAIDIDKWAYENTLENMERNKVKMHIIEGGEESIPDKSFDVLLANINRNILIQQSQSYSNHLKENGTLLLSGILEEDIPVVLKTFNGLGFSSVQIQSKGNWQMIELKKQV